MGGFAFFLLSALAVFSVRLWRKVSHIFSYLTLERKQLLQQLGAAANLSPRRRGSSNAPTSPAREGGRPSPGPLEGPRLRAAERRPAPRRALRRERCERENARAAGLAGDLLTSDSAQLPATSATASVSSRASLLQEVHTVHQEPVSDHERQEGFFDLPVEDRSLKMGGVIRSSALKIEGGGVLRNSGTKVEDRRGPPHTEGIPRRLRRDFFEGARDSLENEEKAFRSCGSAVGYPTLGYRANE